MVCGISMMPHEIKVENKRCQSRDSLLYFLCYPTEQNINKDEAILLDLGPHSLTVFRNQSPFNPSSGTKL